MVIARRDVWGSRCAALTQRGRSENARSIAGRMRAELVGGDHEALVLDRPGADQHLPVVARGRERERARHRDDLGPAGD